MQYEIRTPTPEDGNCFFESIVDQCNVPAIFETISQRAQKYVNDAYQLRQRVVDFCEDPNNMNGSIAQHRQFYIDERRLFGESDVDTWLRCLAEMREPGCWAEHLFIEMTASFLQKNILLLQEDHPQPREWTIPAENSQGPNMAMVYLPNEHFQSIIQRNSGHSARGNNFEDSNGGYSKGSKRGKRNLPQNNDDQVLQ